MKKIMSYAIKRKGVINSLMLVGGIVTVLSNYGCCFFIFHQPELPKALRDLE